MKFRLIIAVVCFVIAACGGATKDDAPTSPAPSSSSSSSSSSGSVPTTTTTPPQCDASAARDIAVTSDDPNGYPPYAVAECSLVYVSSTGELVLRDLVTRAETSLAVAADHARRPSISVDINVNTRTLLISWEAGTSVHVRYGDRMTTMAGTFVKAGEPRSRDHFVAFTAWQGPLDSADTDVWLYDARTDRAQMVLGGAAQQRFADVSATHVVATDFSEDPDGRFDGENDLADILIYEIASAKVTRRVAPNKQAFPILGIDGALAYLEWNGVHPQPKLESFDLKAGSLTTDYSADRLIAHIDYVSTQPALPAFADNNTLEWIANPDGATTLYSAAADGSTPATKTGGLDNLYLFAPAPRIASGVNPSFTILAATDLSTANHGAPTLRAISR